MYFESTYDVPEWIYSLSSALDDKMGFQLGLLTAERVTGSMPVNGNTQPLGLWHGGASAVLIETLASLGAMAAGYPDQAGLGVDLNVSHLLPVSSGRVHGEAQLLKQGKRTLIYQVTLHDDKDRLVAIGRLTCHLTNRPIN